MRTLLILVLSVTGLPAATVSAQVPSGAVAGTVRDASGAVVPGAQVLIVNAETGLTRAVTSSERGEYAAPALPPGSYRVTATVPRFKRSELDVHVQVGTTSVADLTLQVGDVTDTVPVVASTLVNRDRYQVDGVVTRAQIDSVPLNGRNFPELAKLEPGITSPVRGTNNRTFLAALNSGLQTIPRVSHARVTMDGASLATIGGPGAVLQVSQDAVDEFQVATVNFDVATGQTSTAALNIVTRAGGNRFHGTGFAFYRDDAIASYPGLVKDASNPDPFFRRVQAGLSLGGPIRADRIFLFGSYERSDQDGVVAVWPSAPEFYRLGGIFPSPLSGNLLTVRLGAQPHARHHVLVRHSHDDNESFAPVGGNAALLPSAWSRISNRVDQSLAALTSTLSERVVNDARVSVLFMDTAESPAGPEDCAGCFGLGSPRTMVQGAGLTFGRSREGRQTGWRAQVTDDLSWQAGRHQFRLGGNWEHASYATTMISNEPANLTLWTPQQVRRFPAIPLPASFTTVEAVHQLPLRSFQTAIGSDENLQKGFRNSRSLDVIRLYAGDVWRVSPRVTVSGGLSWLYEPNVLNHDLTKPALLAPILGPDRLDPPPVPRGILLPMLGGTWLATSDAKTLVRGGVGRYSDGTSWANSVHLFNERRYLMPLGNGRFNVSGANFLCDGQVLNFSQPSAYTAQRLLDILDTCRRDLAGALDSRNRDFSIRNLNRAKEGMNLSDPDYGTPSAIHAALGVKRELPFGIVASADIVYKRYDHTFLNGIDYNHFYSAAGPVIPACSAAQRTDDRALCSNGPIYFDTTAGRARYRGLLVRVEKRLSAGTQFLVSYALGSYRGTNGSADGTVESTPGRATGFNIDNWFENDGPLPSDIRHVLNISGMVLAPWRVEISYNVSAYSRPPFSPYVAGFDFNDDGTSNDLLPGTRVNQFGRELDRDDLVRLVDAYNRDYVNRVFKVGGNALPIQLPASFEFNDNFFTADLRVGRSFTLGPGGWRLTAFVEVFNLFNTQNFTTYGSDLSNSVTFGQPNAGFSQVFGSGGPRAAQLGVRLGF